VSAVAAELTHCLLPALQYNTGRYAYR